MRIDESIQFKPGLARHRLRVVRAVKTKDEIGGDIITSSIYATVYAQVLALQGREMFEIQQRWADARYKILMQAVAGIRREDRLQWLRADGAIEMDILDVQDPAGASNYTLIYAKDVNAS